MKYFSTQPIRDAQQFIGREREIVQINELLAAGKSCAVIGIDGSGKTSLLNHLAQTAAMVLDDPPLVVYVDLATVRHVSDLYRPILMRLRATGDEEFALDQALQEATTPVLLLLDNLDRAGVAWNGVVRSALRNWINQGKIQIVAASALLLAQIAPDMQQSLVSVPLQPMIEREARSLLNELAAQAQLNLPNNVMSEIMQVAGTQPAQLKFALDAWARSDNGNAFDWKRTVREANTVVPTPANDLSYTSVIETEANDPHAKIAPATPTVAPAPPAKPKPKPIYRADDPSDFLWTLILVSIAAFVWWLTGSWWGALGFGAVLLLWVGIAHVLVKQNESWRNHLYVAATRRLPLVGRFAPRPD